MKTSLLKLCSVLYVCTVCMTVYLLKTDLTNFIFDLSSMAPWASIDCLV